jgi:alkaline phosphatase D
MLDRRAFLLSGLAMYGASARELFAAGPAVQNPKFSTSPFTLGVCSGDPTPDGVVLWTRLAIDPLNGGGMPKQPLEVQWQIATDERLSQVVRSGRTMASPEWAHSVHVEVSGLQPHTWYWYQFRVGNELSPIGRTRTFPRAQSAVDRLRFAIASCQHFEVGLFTAYQHMAEEDLDLVLHLGDYIYEGPGVDKLVRKHVGGELMTVDDYRNRYAQYRSDPALRAVHALFPFLVVWDDHEVDNNYAGLHQEAGAPIEQFALRRAAGYKAFSCSSTARSRTERWRASQCSIRGNTGPISPAATTSSPPAPTCRTRARLCWDPRRKSG